MTITPIRISAAILAGVSLLAVGCSSSTKSTKAPAMVGSVTATGISADRCAANKAAGKITYLSSFDFAATASIVEVVVAKQKGYFDKMCLDVDLKSSFSTANYPLVAANTAQFSSAGSYVEQLNFSTDGAELVTVAMDGKTGVDALLVRADGAVKTPADLKGKKIGIKGALPPAEVALLNKFGLKKGTDYEEVTLQGFDPKQHWALPIDALPVYKSNEPGQLDAAGIKYTIFDPAKEGIPGSFGLIYTSKGFHDKNPTAVQDFVRAAMKGMEDAIANPTEAVDICFKKITEGGNKNFLQPTGEAYRWGVESKLVVEATPKGEGVGLIHRADLDKQVAAYVKAGVLAKAPKVDGTYDDATIKSIYNSSGKVIWPN
jgi:ABC-type nitrate/sulfonate/bicarbonate transport system substrate-binding protein